ncbi:aldo/keto reductase [Paenibacillus thalictri]|uniref:Aldo/keto reductase n=1 Tax=Paenibacillus thalictri TaxID=2527873 RepID=A0A4Q9DU86_9BACL|nr:aldo/keto reductase [Paenibacillus thalictri]TBL79103.1 aldo/keto reductase [Paenibacillus thalictri]
MEYATLGKTGAVVSRIGFGGATAGLKNYLERFDPSDADDRKKISGAVEKALSLGINYYDTAPGYGAGESEDILGAALSGVKESGSHPLFIATKISFKNRAELRRSVETSLNRLRRDRIELLQIHGGSYTPEEADAILADGGMAEEMLKLKQEGLVQYIGFTSEDNNDAVYRFIRSGAFDTMQICYNFIFQHAYEPSRPFGSLLEADRAGLGIITMRTPTSGTFQRWIQQVNPVNTFDYTPALIQFVLSNPYVDVALMGMRDADIVVQNAAICDDLSGRVSLDAIHSRYV